jgi:hypothetical protein
MMSVELGAAAFWLLITIGALSGAASLWAFRRWSNAAELRIAMNRLMAHLMEFQLFADQPIVLFRAQYDLLAANARFLKLLALPSLLLVLPFSALLVATEATFGRAPLLLDKAIVVTVQCNAHSPRGLPDVRLEAPPGIDVETGPVHVPTESQISWRVRPKFASSGELRVLCNGRVLSKKKISAKPGLQWLSLDLPFFGGDTVPAILFPYPAAMVFHQHWLLWFSAGSLLGFLLPALVIHRHEEFC